MTTLQNRRGAVLPLFAILLPVLIMLCAFAINVAYMQLTTTEMKVAADAAARAGGRAWSEDQDLTAARQLAAEAALANTVAGEPLVLSTADGDGEIEFGLSTRLDNGYGRYEFTKVDSADVESGTAEATSIRVNAQRLASGSGSISLLFGGVGTSKSFEPVVSSICTQVDRDIALVLDRSGSMVYCADEEALYDAVYELYWDGVINSSERNAALRDYEGDHGSVSGSIYDREFPPYVLQGFQDYGYDDLYDYGVGMNDYNGRSSGWRAGYDWVWVNTWGGGYYDWQMTYTSYEPGGGDAPPYSRWAMLLAAVDAFIDVLEVTHQNEQIALATFSSSGSLDESLAMVFTDIEDAIDDIRPTGGTSIGEGMDVAIPAITTATDVRPYAAKTIVVLTDGQNNSGEKSPVTSATEIVGSYNVTIHTVTFTSGADQNTMASVAAVGGGKHYHADDGSGLIDIFEEIANNLPTVITE